jgi:epoxyqueuosine reductase
MGNRIFGCDDCLAVCPWNKFAKGAREAKLAARAGSDNPPLAELLPLDEAAFRSRFGGTPIKRTGRDRFLRNVLIAAGNSGDTTLAPSCENLIADPSPLVRGAAIWALSRLLPPAALQKLRPEGEEDEGVLLEWVNAARRADETGATA